VLDTRLAQAVDHWRKLAALTEPVYREMPLLHLEELPNHFFHWSRLVKAVEHDLEVGPVRTSANQALEGVCG